MARCFENNLSPSHFIPILEYKLCFANSSILSLESCIFSMEYIFSNSSMEATLTPLGGILISFIPFLNVPSCNLPIGCVFIIKFPSYSLSDNLETLSSNFSNILKLFTIHRILLLLPSSIFKTISI